METSSTNQRIEIDIVLVQNLLSISLLSIYVITIININLILSSVCNFTVSQVSELIGATKITVKRRMKENGISARAKYVHLADDELDHCIAQILQSFPTIGEAPNQPVAVVRSYS